MELPQGGDHKRKRSPPSRLGASSPSGPVAKPGAGGRTDQVGFISPKDRAPTGGWVAGAVYSPLGRGGTGKVRATASPTAASTRCPRDLACVRSRLRTAVSAQGMQHNGDVDGIAVNHPKYRCRHATALTRIRTDQELRATAPVRQGSRAVESGEVTGPALRRSGEALLHGTRARSCGWCPS